MTHTRPDPCTCHGPGHCASCAAWHATHLDVALEAAPVLPPHHAPKGTGQRRVAGRSSDGTWLTGAPVIDAGDWEAWESVPLGPVERETGKTKRSQ